MYNDSQYLTNANRSQLALTLLAASEFSGLNWKKHALHVARQVNSDAADLHIRSLMTFRESVVYRLCKESDRSDILLQQFFQDVQGYVKSNDLQPRTSAQLGLVYLSSAKLLLRQDEPEKAVDRLREWKPLDPCQPSTMERLVLRDVNIALGNSLRYCGDFGVARELLESTLAEAQSDEIHASSYIDLLCALGDVCCELNDADKAQEILENGLKQLEAGGSRMSAKSTSFICLWRKPS